ncbi:transcription antitermination factor NusB [Hespellia stercorisuis]|uniref:Transcription antitermination protein NusB n=1 Tax=Hespellia stercorisuis DSM 15480 TaxID=1121950 RepID=A0A1M6HND1_9FIRM|nr:transcription antitermination factor NusB [Hespellia stercorisuis]SHJ23670.1 NusB antitermination factor [Hespellia stercorisuis DSM 15480]
MTRSELREHIFQMLFGIEFYTGEEMEDQLGLYLDTLDDIKESDYSYMKTKVGHIVERLEEIDGLLNEETTGWKTSRMNKVDLTIMRLALYEIRWDDDVPAGVAINEAVELAKKYSSDEGPSFVNGVLAKFAKE